MRLKMKSLAAAIALVAATSGAQAALLDGRAQDGELFFLAVDAAGQNTFFKDLGITYSAIVANAANASWFSSINLGSLVTPAQFAFGTGVKWNLAVARDGQDVGFDPRNGGNNGVIATFNAGKSTAAFANGILQKNANEAGFLEASAKLDNLIAKATQKAAVLNDGVGAAGVNSFTVITSPSDPKAFGQGWSDTFGLGAPLNNGATVGTDASLALFHWFYEDAFDLSSSVVKSERLPGVFTLSTSGVLDYTIAAVPLPPAVWLLGSALAGLSVTRRRQTVASSR